MVELERAALKMAISHLAGDDGSDGNLKDWAVGMDILSKLAGTEKGRTKKLRELLTPPLPNNTLLEPPHE